MEQSEEDAFTRFVAEAGGRLARSAYLLAGGDRAAGEDLVQGALERTYRHWPRVVRAGGAEAYVRRALVNAAINRRRGRFREEPLEAIGLDGGPADATDVGLAWAHRDEILRALRTLPPRQRAVVVLRYLDDLSEAETAAVLGCAVGSVKSQASRGLARLREQMSGNAPSPGDGPSRPMGRTR